MKTKSLHLLASALLLAFASCTSDIQELNTEQSPLLKQIVMTTEDFEPEAGSRTLYDIADGAVKCTWASNDTVGVFPDKGAQAYFPMTTGAGTKKAQFSGGGWTLTDGSTYAAYYPFIGDMYLNRNAVPVNYDGQKQVGNGSMAHLGDYDYMVATPTAPEFGSALFMFKHLSALVQLKLTIPQPATLTSVKLVAENKAFAQEGKVDIMAETPGITAVTPAGEIRLDLQDVKTTEANQVVTLYLMLPPADLSAQTLKAVIASDKDDQEVALESKNFQAGKAYALSGSPESGGIVGDGTYKDGVVSLAEAGTMKELLGSDYLSVTSLKVVGPINGDDVRCLRQMSGGSDYSLVESGKLEMLDLSDARIVEGGEWYYWYYDYYSSTKYYTANDEIGKYMFYSCTNLKEIVLPDGATSIGPDAFRSCYALTTVTIGDGVTSIGDYAFDRCYYLTTVTIGDGVTSIGDGAFLSCDALTSVCIKDLSAWCRISFSSSYSNPLGYGAKLYLDNKEVTELVIPEDITEIKMNAFNGCGSIVKAVIPNNVISIGNDAFLDCPALTAVTIGDGVISIGDYAFYECSSLSTVTIGDNVTSIGSSAFQYCSSLSTVIIGEGVTSIGDYAFYECSSLSTVTIGDNVTSIGSSAFQYCSSLSTVIIGEGVTSIGDYAFYECSSLSTVTIGDNVTSIGSSAFKNCSSLSTVTIGDGDTLIGDYAFDECSSLTTVTIGDGVTSIGDYAFQDCCALTSIDIPDNVTSIGNRAFASCSSLSTVTIGDSVTSIGGGAFQECSSLTTVTIGDGVTSIGNGAFLGGPLTSIYIKDLSAWCRITFSNYDSNPLSYGAKFYLDNKELTEIVIPEGITEIKKCAFCGCRGIVKVVIPDNVTSISDGAFMYCDALTTLTIGDGDTSIGTYAFSYCSSLTSVTIGNGDISIGGGAFLCCSSLTTLTIGDGVASIGSSAFQYCSALRDFYCHATTPPSIYSNSFPTYGNKTTLHVPKQCESAYKSSDWGSYFKNIVEMD